MNSSAFDCNNVFISKLTFSVEFYFFPSAHDRLHIGLIQVFITLTSIVGKKSDKFQTSFPKMCLPLRRKFLESQGKLCLLCTKTHKLWKKFAAFFPENIFFPVLQHVSTKLKLSFREKCKPQVMTKSDGIW